MSVGTTGFGPNPHPCLPDGNFLGAVARFGPTTPTRARRLADASVYLTDARKGTFDASVDPNEASELPTDSSVVEYARRRVAVHQTS
jgi:hypothetical protein